MKSDNITHALLFAGFSYLCNNTAATHGISIMQSLSMGAIWLILVVMGYFAHANKSKRK